MTGPYDLRSSICQRLATTLGHAAEHYGAEVK